MLLNNSKYFLGVIHNSLVSIFLATLQCDKFYEILRFAQNDKVRHSKCFFPRNLLNGAHNDQVCHPEVKPNVLGSYEILHQVGVRNKRHRSHLQRKLNVYVDKCSSLAFARASAKCAKKNPFFWKEFGIFFNSSCVEG